MMPKATTDSSQRLVGSKPCTIPANLSHKALNDASSYARSCRAILIRAFSTRISPVKWLSEQIAPLDGL